MRGAFNVLPPTLKGTTAYVTEGRMESQCTRGVEINYSHTLRCCCVSAALFVRSPFRTLILLFRLHLYAVSQRPLD